METLAQLQKIQQQLDRLQYSYADNRPEFWAILLAWEAVRLAWYVVSGDPGTAREKLELVKSALTNAERQLAH